MRKKGYVPMIFLVLVLILVGGVMGWELNNRLKQPVVNIIRVPEIITKYVCNVTSVPVTWTYGTNNQLDYKVRNTVSDLSCDFNGIQTHCSFTVTGDAYVNYGTGTSMLPCHYGKENVKIIVLRTKDIDVGDFITYFDRAKNQWVGHQVIGFNQTQNGMCYVTQGVNSNERDEHCVYPNDVGGRVVVIFRDGVV